MNKRGQVFLIAAIVLALALFSVSIVYNSIHVEPPLNEYRKLSENYLTEFPKVVNFARYNDLDEPATISSFNNAFIGFAKEKEPNFGVFYTFRDSRGNVHIVNTLNKKSLRIEVVSGNRDSRLRFDLVSSSTGATGAICVDGVSCSDVETSASNFGGRYSNVQEIPNIQEGDMLRVTDLGTNLYTDFDISSFTSSVLTSSDDGSTERQRVGARETDAPVVEVVIQEYK